MPDAPDEGIDDEIPRFAVVGRPNAGKSSLINAFIGEDRNIVTDIAGTTRDSIYTRYNKFGFDFYLVDTAGIRRKNKVTEDLEFYSVMRSIRSIENSDVCILMIDATRGIEAQDMNIFQLIQRNNKSLVVVVNKWDLVESKDQKVIKTAEENGLLIIVIPDDKETTYAVLMEQVLDKILYGHNYSDNIFKQHNLSSS